MAGEGDGEDAELFRDSEQEEEEILTPAQLIAKLEEAWLNEKYSPDLLENKSEIVECVMEQLDHMEQNLQRARKGDLKVTIHRMEMERIRYVLSSYLRSRLQKIERFFPHILEKEKSLLEAAPSCLSPQEFTFAKDSQAQPGFLCLPDCEGEAGEHSGGAGDRGPEGVHRGFGGRLPAPDEIQDDCPSCSEWGSAADINREPERVVTRMNLKNVGPRTLEGK
ncbi:DNA replication complex GINS protein SLD5 isoform X2 [Scyliorhinus torazame]|uniref:DNA replication complex GINS protein SLD5 isoform X2 n=1 Tax=Scyliorhinus torazame TaxID=75743 RepID=UPI003B593259